MHELTVDQLRVSVAGSTEELGVAAAEAFASVVRTALESREEVAVILATGNSQLAFARALRNRNDIDWSKISVLHMDEYLGMSEEHPASFRLWMNENIVKPFSPKAFHGVRGDAASPEEELQRYSALIRDLEPIVTVMGIGENGHLAFNDPPADFETTEIIQVVELDDACRLQQVGEGHFPSLEETPRHALSLTVHALLQPRTVLVLTPEQRKANAVKAALEGPVTPMCPASILKTQPQAHLYLDRDSASLLEFDSAVR
jgi:glucosamine-6-phosphate deaminase